jgi:hypothetical protein
MQDKNKDYVYMPFIVINERITVNDKVVWYNNKWKNIFLKIKLFFKQNISAKYKKFERNK